MLSLLTLVGLCPSVLSSGFSASLTSLDISSSIFLTGWSVSPPFFSSLNFDTVTGSYTAPDTGLYSVEAVINYKTYSTITISLGAGVYPAFSIRRTSPSATDLISGLFPLIDIDLALLDLRAILGAGTITLSGVVRLTAGDILRFYYDADTMTVPLTLENTTWSVYRLC